MIALVRIDDRLIHGQVVTAWAKRYSIDYILAVDDELAANTLQVRLMKMATPPGCKSDVFSFEQAVEALKSEKNAKKKIFIVVKTAKVILDLMDAGIEMPDNINVGNVRQKDGKTVVPYILIQEEEIPYWKQLADQVKLTAQLTPDQTSYNLKEALEKVK